MSHLSEKLEALTHLSARPLLEDKDSTSGKTPSVDEVAEFLRKNPDPSDKQWHAWAEKNGNNVPRAEAVAYKLATSWAKFLTSGKAVTKKFDVDALPSSLLKMAMKVESEHSDDPEVQKRIVADHAAEYMDENGEVDPEKVRKYYEGIVALEKQINGE